MSITLGFQFKLISSKLVISIKGTEFTNQVGSYGPYVVPPRQYYHFKFKSISSSLKRLVVHKGSQTCSIAHITYTRHISIFNSSLTKDPSSILQSLI
jgi:hypothetical protein